MNKFKFLFGILLLLSVGCFALLSEQPFAEGKTSPTPAIIAPAKNDSDNGQNGTTLSSTVTAVPHNTTTYTWTIAKSVTPAKLNLFKGDTATANYTVDLTKDTGTTKAYIDGKICVYNGGEQATTGLAITVTVTSQNGTEVLIPAGGSVISVDLGGNTSIAAYTSACYDYKIIVPNGTLTVGQAYKVEPFITILNHSGHLDTPWGPHEKADFTFPAPTLINDSVTVDDTFGGTLGTSITSTTSTFIYTRNFTCGATQKYTNTATIRETNQSASVDVMVNCYELTVSKDANASYTRTYAWDISKTGSQNGNDQIDYSINVTRTEGVISDIMVTGTITITNPAPMTATLTGVTDVMPDATATWYCPSLYVPAKDGNTDGVLTCAYTAKLETLPPGTSTNTATATMQNASFSGTATVDFEHASVKNENDSVKVSDTLTCPEGLVCHIYKDGVRLDGLTWEETVDNTKHISYYLTVCDPTPHDIKNTATLTDSDGTADSSTTVEFRGCPPPPPPPPPQ